MEVKKIKSSKDNVYFNAVINADPTSSASVPCNYIGNLTQSLLDCPSEYYCSIVRFILPIDGIPTFIFPVDDTQPNPDLSYLKIGVNIGGQYPPYAPLYQNHSPIGGTNYEVPIVYSPPSNVAPPVANGTAPYFTNDQQVSPYYWVYSIEKMIQMINNGLATAVNVAGFPILYTLALTGPSNATIGAVYLDSMGKKYVVDATIVGGVSLVLNDTFNPGPIIPATNGTLTLFNGTGDATISYTSYTTAGIPKPYFTYYPTTSLISLTVTDAFLATGMKIYVDRYLLNYLASFNWYYDSFSTNFFLNLSKLPPDQTSPYVIMQDYSTISLWFDLRRILIFSNTLPIVPEALPAKNASPTPGNTSVVSSSANVVNFFPIITDFAVALDDARNLQEVLVYNPTAQYRLVDMTSNSPLNKIDFQFFWEDRFNNILPVPLSAYQQASVKIGFFKKSLYNKNKESW